MQAKIDSNKFAWELPPPRDTYLRLNIRRSTLHAFLGSLFVHLLVLFVVPQQHMNSGEPLASNGDPLVVNLRPRTPASAAIRKTRPRLPMAHRQKAPAPPVVLAVPSPVPAPVTAPDMQAYVNAARARRQSAEDTASRENAEAVGNQHEPSEGEITMATVKRNLNPGANGVFQILSMGSRTAAFSFRGWTGDAGNARREYIQVELGTNSDIQIAIVRRMIELIRRYYQGNFNWESQRLDRVVVLSARTEDNAGLEGFMLKEFFGTRAQPPRVQ